MPVHFPATRWSLIARLPEQPQHIGVLMSLYADAIGAYVRLRLGDEQRDRVEDVVQDVLLDLLHKPDILARAQPGSGSRFRYYVMNLAWLSALNSLRHQRRRDRPGTDAATDEDSMIGDSAAYLAPAQDQQRAMDRAWAVSVVQQALNELTRWSQDGTIEPESVVLVRRHLIEGRSLRTVADEIHLPLATCHRRLAKARMLLQDAIVERLRLSGDIAKQDDASAACAALMQAAAP